MRKASQKMQFLCVAGPLATPYPLCVPELPGHCTWEGEGRRGGGTKVRFSPGPGHGGSVHKAASRELYLWNLWTGPGLYPGHRSPLCVKPADQFPPSRVLKWHPVQHSENTVNVSIVILWTLEIADLSCRHWDILVWLNSSLPNIFHRIVSKGVLELIQKKNEIQRKYIFFLRGFDCTSFMKTDVDTDVNLICVTFQKISWYNIRWQKTNLIRSILRDPS